MILQYNPYGYGEQRDDVFRIGLGFLILLTVIIIIYFISTFMVSGNVHPMISHLTENSTSIPGIPDMLNKLDLGLFLFFVIIIAIPFLWIIVKLLYSREETTVGGI